MELTRRGRAVAGCGLALAVGAALLATPLLLAGAAGVGAILLGVGASFVRRIGTERDALSVSIALEPAEPLVDETATIRIEADRPVADLPLRVVLSRPAAADAGEIALDLDRHESAALTAQITWPVAGTYCVGPPRVVATDPLGLFLAAYEPRSTATVRVRARHPSTIHLGHGGERVAAAFGEHRANLPGAGVEPAKLQRYEAGAQVGRIDWKATARLGEVYVVDPETDTDRQTALLLDHRATMAAGEEPDTPLAYLRHVALAVVGSARDLGDPIGAYAVGDDGVTFADPPGVGVGQYVAVENAVRGLEPTTAGSTRPPGAGAPSPERTAARDGTAGPDGAATADAGAADPDAADVTDDVAATTDDVANATGDVAATTDDRAVAASSAEPGSAPSATAPTAADPDGAGTPDGPLGGLAAASSVTSPTRLHGADRLGARAATRLSDGNGEFSRTLRPFVAGGTEYLHRVESEPLFAAARTYLGKIRGSLWTVIVTDDSRREELRQTVKLARRTDDRVLVVLAPRALFEADDLADLDRAYERYREFESFRRELAAMDRVDAMELAPGERVETVLGAGGERA